jgi:4-alpha-glucanotransferase
VHVELRDRLGLLSRPVEEERAAHEADLDEYRAVLAQRGLLAPESDHDIDSLMVALHGYLGQSPSRLQGVALVDLVGDVVPQNQPGTDQEHPNWRIPVCDGEGRPMLIEDLTLDPNLAARVAQLIAAVRQ